MDSVGRGAEEFNIVSNNHGRTQDCDFSVWDGNVLFEQIWSKNHILPTILDTVFETII